MNALNRYGLALLFAVSTVAGCATTGQPVAKGDEDEAAKNETAPKPPSTEKIQEAKQQQEQAKKAPKVEQPKISASAKAEVDAAVKKWDAAQKAKGGMATADCKGLAANFSRISESALAAQAHFNAGTILESCGYDKDAESEYHASLSANPAYGPAMA